MRNKKILISQSQPADANSSFFKLAEKFKLKLSFTPFISQAPVDVKEFSQQRINILDHTAIVFSSKNSIDCFFNICRQLKIEISKEMKYFCLMEPLANYLQKHIVLRKRKIFVGNGQLTQFLNLFIKHKEEKYLVVGSQNRKQEIADFFVVNGIDFSEAIFFKVSSNDLSELVLKDFGMLVFFSPADVKSLFDNFPGYKQNETLLACFGPTTIAAAKQAGLNVNIIAPTPEALSMSGAIDLYLKNSK